MKKIMTVVCCAGAAVLGVLGIRHLTKKKTTERDA